MTCLRSGRAGVSSVSISFTTNTSILFAAVLLAAVPCLTQDQLQNSDQGPQARPAQLQSSTVTIPAGTQLVLVLTHPLQSRYVHRGDDIYAQITSPVNSDNEMVIPPGTFVQGTVDKLAQRSGERAEVRLQSMSITFPDGYVASIPGAARLETNEGYALKDPGPGTTVMAFLFPVAGAGVGALIGHSVGSSDSTMTTTLPPGCVGPSPECLSSSMPVPGSKGKDTAIGAVIGGAAGMVASMTMLFGSHHFFVDVGTPLEMTLEHPLTLQRDEVAKALRQYGHGPIMVQPVLPRPVIVPPYIPGEPMPTTPTPPIIIPGTPGPDGVPGPPIIIPGTPGGE